MSRLPDGGFTLGGRTVSVRAVSGSGAWHIEGDPRLHGRSLRRASHGAGFVLTDGEREMGRTMSAIGMEDVATPRHLLLEDGRLFRIASPGLGEPGVDLTSWEVPGPYLRARTAAGGWTLIPAVASRGIADWLVLALLVAAEVLDAERPLAPPTPA